jgi:hypothetical protein
VTKTRVAKFLSLIAVIHLAEPVPIQALRRRLSLKGLPVLCHYIGEICRLGRLHCSSAGQDRGNGAQDEPEVKEKGTVRDVLEVHLHPVLESYRAAT